MPAWPLSLPRQELAQRPVAERAAVQPVGRERRRPRAAAPPSPPRSARRPARCSASLWPPMKLYLGKPFHLSGGRGRAGREQGREIERGGHGVPSASLGRSLDPNCWAKTGRFATGLAAIRPRRGTNGRSAMFQGWRQRGLRRARQQLALGQRRVEVGEGHDLARRDAARDVDRLELAGMVEPGRRRQLGQLVHGGAVEVGHALRSCRARPARAGASGPGWRRRSGSGRCGRSATGCSRART